VPAGKLTVVELDERPDGDAIKAHLAAKTGTRPTVPKVFVGGRYLGDASGVEGLRARGGSSRSCARAALSGRSRGAAARRAHVAVFSLVCTRAEM
jgi:hypothetical protein